jgi:hypothetical protein
LTCFRANRQISLSFRRQRHTHMVCGILIVCILTDGQYFLAIFLYSKTFLTSKTRCGDFKPCHEQKPVDPQTLFFFPNLFYFDNCRCCLDHSAEPAVFMFGPIHFSIQHGAALAIYCQLQPPQPHFHFLHISSCPPHLLLTVVHRVTSLEFDITHPVQYRLAQHHTLFARCTTRSSSSTTHHQPIIPTILLFECPMMAVYLVHYPRHILTPPNACSHPHS